MSNLNLNGEGSIGRAIAGQEPKTGLHVQTSELLAVTPRPGPILFLLVIVLWLVLPFIVSAIFLALILGIYATAEEYVEEHSSASSRAPFALPSFASEREGWDGALVVPSFLSVPGG